jgi:methylmalonyl-CoA mutase C-terminal domain/subunit
MTLMPKIVELLKAKDAGDIVVLGGGVIPPDDAAELKKRGVREIFGPGTPTDAIVAYVRKVAHERAR